MLRGRHACRKKTKNGTASCNAILISIITKKQANGWRRNINKMWRKWFLCFIIEKWFSSSSFAHFHHHIPIKCRADTPKPRQSLPKNLINTFVLEIIWCANLRARNTVTSDSAKIHKVKGSLCYRISGLFIDVCPRLRFVLIIANLGAVSVGN